MSAHYWYRGVPTLGAVTVHGRTGPQVDFDGVDLIGKTVSTIDAALEQRAENEEMGLVTERKSGRAEQLSLQRLDPLHCPCYRLGVSGRWSARPSPPRGESCQQDAGQVGELLIVQGICEVAVRCGVGSSAGFE